MPRTFWLNLAIAGAIAWMVGMALLSQIAG